MVVILSGAKDPLFPSVRQSRSFAPLRMTGTLCRPFVPFRSQRAICFHGRMRRYFVYIMSSRSRVLYVGITGDLLARVLQHKSGAVESFTSSYRVDRLVYLDETNDVHAALEAEKRIKGWIRKRKVALIEATNPTWVDLAADWYGEEPPKRADPSLRSGSAFPSSHLRQELLHQRHAIGQRRRRLLDPDPVGSGEADATIALHEQDQLARIEAGILREIQRAALRTGVHARHAERTREQPQPMARDQRLRGLGQVAETIDELLLDRLELVDVFHARESLVDHQPLVHVAAIPFGKQRLHVQVDLGRDAERLVETRLAPGLQRAHRRLQHVVVELEADFGHLARLLLAEHFAGAADLEIVHREIEAGAQVLHHLDRLEALACLRGQRLLGRRQQVRIGLMVRT